MWWNILIHLRKSIYSSTVRWEVIWCRCEILQATLHAELPPLLIQLFWYARRLWSWALRSVFSTQQILEEHKYLHRYKIVVYANWPFYGRLTVFLLIEMRSSLALSCSAESEIPSFLKRTPMAAMRCLGASEMMTSVWAATHWSLLSPPATWCMSTWHDCNNRTGTVKLWWWHDCNKRTGTVKLWWWHSNRIIVLFTVTCFFFLFC